MDMYTLLLIVFAAGIVYLGARLLKKVQFIRSQPDEETHSQRSDIQQMLKQRLEEAEKPPENPEEQKSADGK